MRVRCELRVRHRLMPGLCAALAAHSGMPGRAVAAAVAGFIWQASP